MFKEYCDYCQKDQTVNMNETQVRCYRCGQFLRKKTKEECREIKKLVTQPFRKIGV